MPCYRPVKAWYGNLLHSGKREIVFSRGQAQSCIDLSLPCGTCVGCRLEKARQWAMRCRDEASLYQENCFVTLTISPEKLKEHGKSLDHSVFQKFMKRLRKDAGGQMIRFFMCGEYGSKTGRPHYHSLLFNYNFKDRVFFKVTASGEKVDRSATLERLWPYGYSSVGDVTFGSAAYVARYHLKKVGNPVTDNHYLDKSTGELLRPEYIRMSRGSSVRGTGGIARGWYDRFKSDVYPLDRRVINGVDTKPCKYYDTLHERESAESFEKIKLSRIRRVDKKDNTEERLAVKEEVKVAQVRSLKTSLED